MRARRGSAVEARAAEQQPRQLGGEVGLRGGAARLARRAPGELGDASTAIAATARNTPAPPSSRRSAIVKRPVGGMWKKLNASALSSDVARPSQRPQ